jgi:hypothetical protein
MFADSLSRQLAIGWISGTLVSAAGLAASFVFDLPTGAAMVCAFGASLALAGVLYPFLRGDQRRSMHAAVTTVRWVGAIILAGSALQLAAAPRADQPLFDLAEYVVPSLRTLYFSRAEATTYADASEHAERYRVTGRAAERKRAAQSYRGAVTRRFHRCPYLFVPQILWRDAQGRAIRHGRSAHARARAHPLARASGSAGRSTCACACSMAAAAGAE